jgi:hypothetical protein
VPTIRTKGKCVHCLRLSSTITHDHGLPDSWYPDSTPANVQRWTAPSCTECNRALGRLERDLLVRVVLCIDPKKEAVSGLAVKVLRSLGRHTEGLSPEERAHRDRLGAKLKAELLARSNVSAQSIIPGLGPHEGSPWLVPIPWAGLSILAEKIARVSEHRVKGRFVETPYGVRTSVDQSGGVIPKPLVPFATFFDFGPGFRIARLFSIEDPLIVRYWISIWGSLHLRVYIDLEDELRIKDGSHSRVTGLSPENIRAMSISSYLRNMSNG